MSSLATFRAWLARRTVRQAAARPCCYGHCTTADERTRGTARPAEHIPNLRIPAQRDEESE